nr:polysaccharide biosynthesis tyrosine autokinase [Muribaculaceae bacterium]
TQNAFSMSAADPMVALKNFIDETELEVMKSRNNLVKIVDSLNLSYSYYRKGALRDIALYNNNAVAASMDHASLAALKSPIDVEVKSNDDATYDIKIRTKHNQVVEKKDLENQTLPCEIQLSCGTLTLSRVPTISEFEGEEKIRIVSPLAAATEISKNLTIEFAKNSEEIIRLSLLNTVFKRGDDIVDALIAFYNKDIIEDKNRSAVQTEAFILDRLVMINDELRDVESRLQQYRLAHNVANLEAQSSANITLSSSYQSQLAELEAQLRIVEEIEQLVSTADTFEPLPSAINDNNLSGVIENYNRKVNQFNRTLEGTTDNNPLIASIREELSRDKSRILQNIDTFKSGIQSRIRSTKNLENQSLGQLSSTPTVDKGLQEIFREQQVKVNIYTFLLQRREEIALQKTLAVNTARLIDDPMETAPVSPKKMIIFAAAFLLGIAVPCVIIFLRRMLFPIFSEQEELERLTEVPILGEICEVPDKDQVDGIVVGENVSTPVAELFRLLRNNISFTRSGVDSKVILITSTISGEGKTFVAANLAMTYALMGKKVAVIGMDLRRPMLAHSFGLSNHRGVTTYLSGQETDLSKLLYPSKVNPNLCVMPAGPVPPNPNELLMSSNMTRLMSELRNQFDYVIIDSAPIGIISDTVLILRHSDLQLYVTRANYSRKSTLKVLHNAVRSGKFSSVYIVLNGVNMSSNSYLYRRYGEYGRYGRKAHTYGYGYNQENAPDNNDK